MKLKIKHLYLILWIGIITYASVTPSKKIPEFNMIPHLDKIVHLIMYAVMTIFIIPVHLKQKNYSKTYLFSGSISFLTGIAFELVQKYLTDDRSASLLDIIANTLGVVIGLLMYRFLFERQKIEKIIFKIE